jgi:hypothetical protein
MTLFLPGPERAETPVFIRGACFTIGLESNPSGAEHAGQRPK